MRIWTWKPLNARETGAQVCGEVPHHETRLRRLSSPFKLLYNSQVPKRHISQSSSNASEFVKFTIFIALSKNIPTNPNVIAIPQYSTININSDPSFLFMYPSFNTLSSFYHLHHLWLSYRRHRIRSYWLVEFPMKVGDTLYS